MFHDFLKGDWSVAGALHTYVDITPRIGVVPMDVSMHICERAWNDRVGVNRVVGKEELFEHITGPDLFETRIPIDPHIEMVMVSED